ncbi:hypothetical protein CDAR_73331 [Caerostris darwini]|uniref:Ribosomal protein S19 n=1 Tax=Caerostris darwini TaxID=1538125 RepID=A0AAV4T0V3_9ARAC|nr:hypothetical protein CDAR_73331 [Caerostris darwini]
MRKSLLRGPSQSKCRKARVRRGRTTKTATHRMQNWKLFRSAREKLATAQGRNNHCACKVSLETAGEWVLGLLGSKDFLVRTRVGKNFRVPPSIPKKTKKKKNISCNRYGIM